MKLAHKVMLVLLLGDVPKGLHSNSLTICNRCRQTGEKMVPFINVMKKNEADGENEVVGEGDVVQSKKQKTNYENLFTMFKDEFENHLISYPEPSKGIQPVEVTFSPEHRNKGGYIRKELSQLLHKLHHDKNLNAIDERLLLLQSTRSQPRDKKTDERSKWLFFPRARGCLVHVKSKQ
jgi:hypothetical protein